MICKNCKKNIQTAFERFAAYNLLYLLIKINLIIKIGRKKNDTERIKTERRYVYENLEKKSSPIYKTRIFGPKTIAE